MTNQERIKEYTKQKDVSLSEVMQCLFPDVERRKANRFLQKAINKDFEMVVTTINDLAETKSHNEMRFKDCGFMTRSYSGHLDCKALCKAYCLLEGECNFFKTDKEILDGILKYGDGSAYIKSHTKKEQEENAD